MALYGEKAVVGGRVVVGAKSQPVGVSLWRESSYRETCVGGSNTLPWLWLALARRQLSGDVAALTGTDVVEAR